MYFTLFIKKASKLLAQFDEGSVLGFVDGYDVGNPDEVKCVLDFTRERAKSKLASSILSALSGISDIPDRFTIEVVKFTEIEERSRTFEVSDIGDDIRESRVDIGLIEFSME
jgi:hypothetical protein